MGDESHPQDFLGDFFRFIRILGEFDAASFSSASGMVEVQTLSTTAGALQIPIQVQMP